MYIWRVRYFEDAQEWHHDEFYRDEKRAVEEGCKFEKSRALRRAMIMQITVCD